MPISVRLSLRASLCAGLGALCLLAIGCGQSSGTNPPPLPDAGGSGGSAAGGSGGSTNLGSGGSPGGSGGAGGTTISGSGGDAVVDAMPSGDASTDEASGSDAGPTEPQDFTCSLILGAGQTLQWYNAGFEPAVGSAKWEIKATDNTYTEAWAMPNSAFWNVTVQSPCTTSATAPDRVLFIVYSKALAAQADWEAQLNKAMANIKSKYPSVKRIDLLSMVRGPDNKMCGTAVATQVSAEQDMAMKAVADASAGMIKVGPEYFAPSCAAFATTNNTNLTPAGAMAVGQMVAASYK